MARMVLCMSVSLGENWRKTISIELMNICNSGSIRDDTYWTSRKNSLELIELSSINKVSLV